MLVSWRVHNFYILILDNNVSKTPVEIFNSWGGLGSYPSNQLLAMAGAVTHFFGDIGIAQLPALLSILRRPVEFEGNGGIMLIIF